jgi:plasmid stabilization system protein ParE
MATITLQPAGVTVTIKDLTADDLQMIADSLIENYSSDERLRRLFEQAADKAQRMIERGRVDVVEVDGSPP